VTHTVNDAETHLAHFVVDASASRFTVQAFATGILSAMGHNPKIGIGKFSGAVDFSPEALEARGFQLSIAAESLSVQDEISDKDRGEIERVMKQQVLQTTRYPAIVYEASTASVTRLDESLYYATLNGSLNLHGVTRSQPVTARVAMFGEMLRASGEFNVRQSDYQIKPVVVAGGALKVKDELKFSFEMVARVKQ